MQKHPHVVYTIVFDGSRTPGWVVDLSERHARRILGWQKVRGEGPVIYPTTRVAIEAQLLRPYREGGYECSSVRYVEPEMFREYVDFEATYSTGGIKQPRVWISEEDEQVNRERKNARSLESIMRSVRRKG